MFRRFVSSIQQYADDTQFSIEYVTTFNMFHVESIYRAQRKNIINHVQKYKSARFKI